MKPTDKFLFVLVPAVELALLIEVGGRIGTVATLGLIIFTGALGAYLARQQGLSVLRRMREEAASGHIPAAPVVDGVIILVAGALLVTPGLLTDAFGFFCLIPPCRQLIKTFLKNQLQKVAQRGDVHFSVDFRGGAGPSSSRPMKDVTPRDGPAEEKAEFPKLKD